MKSLLVFILCLATSFAYSEVPSGSYQGYLAVEQKVRSRLIKPGKNWSLSMHLTGIPNRQPRPDGLEGLLGMYNDGRFQNGDPNALNVTLWYLLFSKLAKQISFECNGFSSSEYFQFRAKQTIRQVCASVKQGESYEEERLLDYWVLLMGYDARFSEFESWVDYANSKAIRELPGMKRFEYISKALFLSPYFLIRQ